MKRSATIDARYEKSVFLLIFFSTFMLIQFGIFDLFWIMQGVVIMAQVLRTKQLRITKDKMIRALYITWILSTLFCFVSNIPLSYKKNSIIAVVFLVPSFFIVSDYQRYIKSEKFVMSIKKALLFTCTIQLLWCFVQFILYSSMRIDLNQIVFNDILHMVENPSQYKLGVYHPSGMCWHSAFMAPICIIGFVISDSYFIKCLAIFDAIVCNNATAMIGIGACLLLSLGFSLFSLLKTAKKSIRKKTICAVTVIVIAFIPLLFYTDTVSVVAQKIIYIYKRASSLVYDGGSANAHIRYYTAYPDVVKSGNIMQFLFGYGTGNSGYPISKLFGQYAELKSWAVESDIMNQMYSSGIVGFLFLYGFLFIIAIKGLKIDKRYFVLIISIIAGGITYNIQFEWLIFIELLIYLCVKNKVNLFQVGESI